MADPISLDQLLNEYQRGSQPAKPAAPAPPKGSVSLDDLLGEYRKESKPPLGEAAPPQKATLAPPPYPSAPVPAALQGAAETPLRKWNGGDRSIGMTPGMLQAASEPGMKTALQAAPQIPIHETDSERFIPLPLPTGGMLPVRLSTAKAVANTALGQLSGENAATMIGAEFGGAALKAAAAAPQVAKLLAQSPKVAKAVNLAASAAIPATFTGLQATGGVEGIEQAKQLDQQGRKAEADQARVQAATQFLMAALSGVGTIAAVHGILGLRQSRDLIRANYPTSSEGFAARDILGLGPDAGWEEIRSAYRKAAAEHHPDRGGDPEAYLRVQAAYNVLKDEFGARTPQNRAESAPGGPEAQPAPSTPPEPQPESPAPARPAPSPTEASASKPTPNEAPTSASTPKPAGTAPTLDDLVGEYRNQEGPSTVATDRPPSEQASAPESPANPPSSGSATSESAQPAAPFSAGQVWEHRSLGSYRVEAVDKGRVTYTYTNPTGGVQRSSMPVKQFERLTSRATLASPDVEGWPAAETPQESPVPTPAPESQKPAGDAGVAGDAGAAPPAPESRPVETPAAHEPEQPPTESAVAARPTLDDLVAEYHDGRQGAAPAGPATPSPPSESSAPTDAAEQPQKAQESPAVSAPAADEPPAVAAISESTTPSKTEPWQMSLQEWANRGRKSWKQETAAERKQHHDLVAKALAAGEDVPAPVLWDYPDLQAQRDPPGNGQILVPSTLAPAWNVQRIPRSQRTSPDSAPNRTEETAVPAAASTDAPEAAAPLDADSAQALSATQSPSTAESKPEQIALTGNTFPYKNIIRKQLGGHWNATKKAWIVDDTPANRKAAAALSKRIVISPVNPPAELLPAAAPQPTSETPAIATPPAKAPSGEESPSTAAKKAATVETEPSHEPVATPGEHQSPLEAVPANDVPGTRAAGHPRSASAESVGSDEGRAGGPDRAGTPVQPGLGNGPGELGVPAERGGPAAPRGNTTLPESSDYRITDLDRIGEGGPKQKAARNLDAIRTLKAIESEGRPATPEEQKLLVQYTGWGGMPQPFAADWAVPRDWQGVREELTGLLTPEEFASARASTPNAHYTSPSVIRGMWRALERMGFQPNELYAVLEPSMGAGHFFGLMPEEIAGRAQRVGIELDSITGRIAKALYPLADVHVAGFEAVRLPNDYFDLAVSNVPFGNYPVHDPALKRNPLVTKSIHDYFFAKAIEKVRPGGIVAFITSSFTLDKANPAMRKYLASKADLVAAIRLPNTAFKGNAGTEVTTDVLFLKKRAPQTEPQGEPWIGTEPIAGTQRRPDGSRGPVQIPVNEYYARHPEMMLGQMTLEGSMYAGQTPTLSGDLTEELLNRAIAALPENVLEPLTIRQPSYDLSSIFPEKGAIKEGGYVVKDGVVMVLHGGQLRPAGVNAEQAKRIRAILPVRDALRDVFRAQLEDAPEAQVKNTQVLLGVAYDAFIRSHGPLHQRANARAFADDPDAPLLLSLENWDSETKTATKAPIFTERTIERYRPVQSASSARDALSVALNEKGRIDWARMQELTGQTPDELRAELGPLVFENPSGRQWEPADEYLSGNVRKKLAEAQAAARVNPRYERNVKALAAVQPEDLRPEEIDARLGSSWISKDDVRQFLADVLEVNPNRVHVGHSEALGSWTVQIGENSVANTKTWGTERFTGDRLIEDALNLRNPTAYDRVSDDQVVVNEQQTLAAREMQQQIKDRFKQWVWEHPERAERLAGFYNEEFNNLRLREFDGSHLTFPGMSAGITLRPHQKNAIWRMLQGGNTLLAHVVGAGKTFEIIAGAMEMRRIGLARKPMIVVPKNRVDGTGSDFLQLYPAANVLVMSSEDFTAANRPKLMSRIATGNWDSVIVSYESFERLPIADETFNRYLQTQIDELEDYIREANTSRSDVRIVKELEKAKKRLEAKLRDKAEDGRKDRALTFEELGVDALFVDEADNFKNLFFPTKMTRIAGIPNTESKRAFDMFIKTQYVSQRNNGRGVVFATGTPIANTMAEMFTMQRYLQPQWLRDHGLQHFDAWAQTFGEVRPTLEVAPDASGFRMTNRFSRFVNIPELVSSFRLVADVQTAEMLKLPTPSLKGGAHQVVSAPASPEQRAFLQGLAARSKDIRERKVKPHEDNMLNVSTDGRKAALDLRLVDPLAADFADSKVNQCADRVAKIWKQTLPKQSAQLVFLDFSKPAEPGERKFSVYDDLKQKLVARGIPAKEIAFIHDAGTDAEKEKLFQAVNGGKVRVLLGSTQKMGVGLNVQKRLIAAHHLDAPWRPRDIEQRDGRILRQGNTNAEVQIFRYVTEPSFDAKMWDTLAGKAAFIGQVMRGDVSVRSAEDVSETALSYAEVAAVASGNPAIREKTVIDAEVRKLDSLRARHDQQQAAAQRDVQTIPQGIRLNEELLRKVESDLAIRDRVEPGFVVGGKSYTGEGSRKKAAEAIHDTLEMHRNDPSLLRGNPQFAPARVGTYRGIAIEALYPYPATMKNEDGSPALPQVQLHGAATYEAHTNQDTPLGTVASLENAARNMDTRVAALTDKIEKDRKTLADTKAILGQKFPKLERLKELLARQAELAKQLQTTADDPQAEGAVVSGEPADSAVSPPGEPQFSRTPLSTEKRLESEAHFQAGVPINLVPLRAAAKDPAAFDRDILKLADQGKIFLTRVDHVYDDPTNRPGSRNTLVQDDRDPNVYYVAAQKRGAGPQFARVTPGFYSQLERVIEQKVPVKTSPAQALAILKNPQNGVKADEMKWTGLDDFLSKHSGPVTRQELLDFAKANAVRIEEVILGEPKNPTRVAELEAKLAAAKTKLEQSESAKEGDRIATVGSAPSRGGYAYSTGKVYEAQRAKDGRLYWRKVDEFGEVRSGRSDRFIRELQAQAPYPWLSGISQNTPVTMAGVDPLLIAEVGQLSMQLENALRGDGKPKYPRNYILSGAKNVREFVFTAPAVEEWGYHDAAHYGDTGKGKAIAWARVNDRKGPNRETILHVDEIQSKRFSEGRVRGFKSEGATAERLQTELNEARLKRSQTEEALSAARERFRYGGIGLADRSWEAIDQAERANSLALKELDAAEKRIRSLVPPAPFSKNFEELVFRRLLRYAVEKNYDSITWTTGQQQADRYDLSKQVERIVYSPETQSLLAYDKSGRNVVPDEKISPEKLPDYIGKEVAERLLKTPPAAGSEVHELSGLDLKIGGEKHDVLYDEKLPRYAEKLAKKWGSQVTNTTVNVKDGRETVHALPITPAMRASVLEGQPLFAKSPTPQPAKSSFVVRHGSTVLASPQAVSALADIWGAEAQGARLTAAQAELAARQLEVAQPKLAQALRAAAAEHPHLIVASGENLAKVKEILRHERFHEAQAGLERHLGEYETDFLADPLAQKAISALRANGYAEHNFGEEIGAHLAAGQFDGLGLSPAEALQLAEQYFTALSDAHGAKLKEAVRGTIAPALKRALDAAIERSQSESATDRSTTGRADAPSRRGGEAGTGRVPGRVPGGVPGAVPEFSRAARLAAGERGSAPMLSDLAGWLQRKFGDEKGKANYSGLGALSDKYLRNLTQLEQRSPEAHAAAIRAASSRAQSATILRAAVIPIQKALTGSEFTWPELRLALIESRLRGLRNRWEDFSDEVRTMSDEQLADAFDTHLVGLLEAIEGKRGLPQDLAQTAAALIHSGERRIDPAEHPEYFENLRALLAQTFEDAAQRVATVMDPERFDRLTADPHVRAALGVYKSTVEAAMAENHALNEGIFSNALGPLDTYYPLISLDRDAAKGGAGRRVPYHKPRNMANAFATGLSDGYDAGMEALRERLAAAVRSNDKAALIQSLTDEGLLQSAVREDNLFIDPQTGEGYQGERVEIQAGRQILQNGQSTFIPPKVALAPKWLARELRPILERNQINTPTVVDKILRAVNTFALSGPADFVFHSSNVLGALVANTPFLADTLAGKALSAPFIKKFAAIGYVLATDPTTEEAARDLIEMAKLGVIPDRYASETFSKKFAEDLGAEVKRFQFGPALYGPKGLDIRARLLLYRLAKQLNSGASPQHLYHFVNQLGNYVPALQSQVERSLKTAGLAPFYTAGSTMIRNGINAWTGAGPMPKQGFGLRFWQQLTGGAIGALALWAITYHAMTGKWPWIDKRSKLFQIPVGGGNGPVDPFRRTKVGKALWGDGPEVGYINFGFFNPLTMRGARAMGIPGFYETRVLHGSYGQSVEAGERDMLNAYLHPALGPVPRALFVGLTGEEPYVTSLRERTGAVGMGFYPAIPPKTKPGIPTHAAKALAALREMNAFWGAIGENTGFLGDDKGKKGNQWVRMAMDLTMPGLVANASNPYKRFNAVQQQKRAMGR